MPIKSKRPRLEKTKKLIDKSTYMDFNQQKPHPNDPNEIEKTPLAPLPNSGEDVEPAEPPKEV
jgi:hypothetical protein